MTRSHEARTLLRVSFDAVIKNRLASSGDGSLRVGVLGVRKLGGILPIYTTRGERSEGPNHPPSRFSEDTYPKTTRAGGEKFGVQPFVRSENLKPRTLGLLNVLAVEEERRVRKLGDAEKCQFEVDLHFHAISEFTSIANVSDTEQPIVIPIRKIASGGSVKLEPQSFPRPTSPVDSEKFSSSATVRSSPLMSRHTLPLTVNENSISPVSPLSPICNGNFNTQQESSGTLKRGVITEEKEYFVTSQADTNLGSIELTVTYDSTTCSLHVTLHRAKGLRAMDIHGTSDPFCKLNLVPLTKTSHRLRTKTCLRTINPEFHEKLTFYSVSETDLSLQSLHILVLDDDKYGHDFLGEARFPLNRLRPHISRDLCLNLCKHYPVPREEEVWGEEECWQHGKIFLTLCFSTKKRALIVNLIKCTNLIPMDSNGFSDPFIKLYLKPDLHKRKYKTGVKWKTLNPIFNEEFAIETKITELSKQTLVITVWDKDYGKSNDYLGCLELCCNSKGDRLRHWVDMMKYPDHKHEGIHNLSIKPLSS
ncbi:double C2-like domain-containing protein beta [Diaphorina citri]|uniref:Double C2-like domain-containing protein beta n=1 Tax=Diaphorina citri TaxID=121845 RepID=A0A1S3DSP5_DIACI|nr:double C2-like domain-containing protein beta [Diaphorina citri]